MKRRIVLPVVVAIAILVALSVYLWSRNGGTYVSAKRGEIVEAIYGLGKVKARRQVEIKVGVLSSVQEVFVKEGDVVEKGASLIRFADGAPFRSPLAGTVTLVAADPGETVSPQVAVIRVEDLTDRYIEVALEQQGALRVRKGLPAEVVFESLRNEKLTGQVTALFSKNEEFLAHIEVPGLKMNILPGMTADVAIVAGKKQDALLVPLNAIANGQVIVKRERRTLKIPVKIGGIDGQWAEVVEGDVRLEDQIAVKSAR
jgi:membrane fusion protein, macrolide-specific efflux system